MFVFMGFAKHIDLVADQLTIYNAEMQISIPLLVLECCYVAREPIRFEVNKQ